jgi:hypothetical protein
MYVWMNKSSSSSSSSSSCICLIGNNNIWNEWINESVCMYVWDLGERKKENEMMERALNGRQVGSHTLRSFVEISLLSKHFLFLFFFKIIIHFNYQNTLHDPTFSFFFSCFSFLPLFNYQLLYLYFLNS